jgi:error-prone DNA polymerase
MPGYVELHAHSNFSLLDGASHPEDLVWQAARLGMDTLALTDHDAVYGAVRFARAASEYGIRPIFGAEMTLEGGHHLTLLVKDQTGWENLCSLITHARHNAPKGRSFLQETLLADHTQGLIALSGCSNGEISTAVARGDSDRALRVAARYRDWFGPEDFWIELQHHLLPGDDAQVVKLVQLAKRLGVGYVATNNVHYTVRDGHRLQDVLTCIRHGVTLDSSGMLLRANSEYYLKTEERLLPLFADIPEALTQARQIAERCDFELTYGLQDLPPYTTPTGEDPATFLAELCEQALPVYYPDASSEVRDQLAHELAVIERGRLANYFLIVWDIIRFSREHGIRCQGRGSAANSLVAYLLGISPIDPLRHDLVFERFLSDERQMAPDIDIDFQADRREEVIQYLYRKYGHAHTAMACTIVTFRARSAIRDVGKALGFPPTLLDRAAKTIDYRDLSGDGITGAPGFQDAFRDQLDALPWRHLLDLTGQIRGFPRHLGIHNGGMILMGAPLATRLPTEPATMDERYVVQWDKEALEEVGLIKVDILGLRMLSVIDEAFETASELTGQELHPEKLLPDDPAVFAMIREADTAGVFQVESRAQAQVLPQLKPERFEDLVISVALIRPGPIQGNMVHPYLRRREGSEPVTYPHPSLEKALAETLGVILFQEQVLKVARDMAGFTGGQGELLRRALGSKRAAEDIETFHTAFIEGAQQHGVSRRDAKATFDKLRAFGGYSFAKSHAAAFAVLVYQSAWLKRYHPTAFYAALLNHQPMGFWSPAVLVGDARRHGVETLPLDVNTSYGWCAVEGDAIRLGFNYVIGMGEEAGQRIDEARFEDVFLSLEEFCYRTRLPRKLIEKLILVGAMDAFGLPRRQLLWELGKLHYHADELPLLYPQDEVEFPPLSDWEKLSFEQAILGLSTSEHVLTLFRPKLVCQGVYTTRELRNCEAGQRAQLAGKIVVHQAPPTAKGFHFITLEDEEGLMDVVVRPDVYGRYREVIRGTRFLLVEGVVQRKGEVVNLLALHVASVPQ